MKAVGESAGHRELCLIAARLGANLVGIKSGQLTDRKTEQRDLNVFLSIIRPKKGEFPEFPEFNEVGGGARSQDGGQRPKGFGHPIRPFDICPCRCCIFQGLSFFFLAWPLFILFPNRTFCLCFGLRSKLKRISMFFAVYSDLPYTPCQYDGGSARC